MNKYSGKKLTRADGIILAFLAVLILFAAASVLFGSGGDSSVGEDGEVLTLNDYNGKQIGSVTGTVYDEAILSNLPDAKISYFSSYGDMLTALVTGKLDGFAADEPVVRYMMINNDQVTFLPQKLESYGFAFAFPKTEGGKALRDEFNAFVRAAKEDGSFQSLDDQWFGKDDSVRRPPDLSALSGEKRTLKLAIDPTCPPFTTLSDGKAAGFEIDIAYLFCLKNGYDLSIINYNFDAILPALQSGLADFACSTITPTEERAESVYFSDSHYDAGAVLAVRVTDVGGTVSTENGSRGFFQQIADSFEKNFIREGRWKMILQGIGITCLITVLSVLFGSLLAFLICLFRRLDSVLANHIADLYVKLLQGTPIVVLLLILYYVVFARSDLDGIAVAVIGFTLNFAAYASEIMRSGIESVDEGQRAAALALGYTEWQAFFRYVFPQAAVRFLPVYRGEMISLLKNTSVVGYIAIMDLTRMSDIIRSRTYEAFFPLIATAAIYFLLAWILSLIMKQLLAYIDPRLRKSTVKEVRRS